jgi:hypothetical protein
MKGALKRAATGFIKRQQRGEPGDKDIGEGRNEKKEQTKAKKKWFRPSVSGLRLEAGMRNNWNGNHPLRCGMRLTVYL